MRSSTMRRIGIGALALIVVAALVVLLWVKPWSGDGDGGGDAAGRGGEPASPPARHQKVYRIADAEPAVAGEDFRVLQEIPGPIGHKAEVLLPDGDLVLVHRQRYSEGTGNFLPNLVQIWDPDTGERETVPTRWPGGLASVTATSATDLWATFGVPGVGRPSVMVHYDRASGQTRLFTMPDPAGAKSSRYLGVPEIGGDGRIYFITGSDFCYRTRCSTPRDRELWSFAPDAPSEVRREATNVAYFAASKRLLVWAEPRENIEDSAVDLHVRRNGSAKVHTVSVPDCWYTFAGQPIEVTNDVVYLSGCGRVYDDKAKLMTQLSVYSHDLSGMTDRWIARGWTLLDRRTGRLLRTAGDRIWHSRPVAMSGDLILLPSPDGPRHTRNGTWMLARMTP